jgi:hypothetical protein
MSKHPLKPPSTQNAQREKPLDANTQLLLLGLEKLPPALDPSILDDGSDLIPSPVMEHFCALLVLFRIGLSAQNAQRVHGVPASLLIGKYLVDYGWGPEHSGEEAEQLFLEEAEILCRNLPGDVNLLSSPVEYAIALQKLGGLVNSRTGETYKMYLADVVGRILEHGLLECDYRYGTGGLYDIGTDLCPEDVATVLGCSVKSVCRLLDSGELVGHGRWGDRSWRDWRVNGQLLRSYVQRAQWQKFKGSLPPALGDPAVKTDARQEFSPATTHPEAIAMRFAEQLKSESIDDTWEVVHRLAGFALQRGPMGSAAGLSLVPKEPTVAPSVPTDAC